MHPFAALAAGSCPPHAELLLAMAREFRSVDPGAPLRQLDDLALPLFGAASLPVRERVLLAARTLGGPDGLRAGPPEPLDGLWLDRVLATRTGHPGMLAAVYVEAARRAGFELSLLSSRRGWYVGAAADETLLLIDPAGPGRSLMTAAPRELRRHCAHELGYAVLGGLAARFRAAGRHADARRASGLRLHLPIDDALRDRLRAEHGL
jgi:regulator of sirC expression with transglutaminase-like and TPR domain